MPGQQGVKWDNMILIGRREKVLREEMDSTGKQKKVCDATFHSFREQFLNSFSNLHRYLYALLPLKVY